MPGPARGLRSRRPMQTVAAPCSGYIRVRQVRKRPTTPVARRYTCSMVPVRRLLTLLLFSVPGAQRSVAAQDVSVKLGFARTIKSAIMNEDRKVLVHLPAGYDTSGKIADLIVRAK